ncbi:hypothetical protein OHC33_000868 [Knufia fluminis]|uniref:Uncharacterized protein n=1 Tax=Knufia fluminis TaxID=191047 RepID=A0AAN8I8P0_9EURO|nr:hypothetical protein OHC33_000868 [Knufia fluminis]
MPSQTTQPNTNSKTKRSMLVRVKGIDGIYRYESLCDVLNRLAGKGRVGRVEDVDALAAQLEGIDVDPDREVNLEGVEYSEGGTDDVEMEG